jgi:hypothetical protein
LVQDFLSGWFEVYLGFVLDLLRVGVWFILSWFVVCGLFKGFQGSFSVGLRVGGGVSVELPKDGLGFM